MEVLGFVGLGAMGGPMAVNLVRRGYGVVGFDPDPGRQEQARSGGVRLLPSTAEVAQQADRTIVSMVRDVAQTRAVLDGPQGILSSGRTEGDLVIMSSLDPTSMERLTEDAGARGLTAVAAPVSGGLVGAREASLTIIASGDAAALDRLQPMFAALGTNIFVVGDRTGMAQAAKLANQLMLAVSMLGAREGMEIATSHGVPGEVLSQLLEVSTGDSWAARNWDRVRAFWEHYAPGNELDIILKDVNSALREGAGSGLAQPFTSLARDRLQAEVEAS